MRKLNAWNKEKCTNEALKYNTRTEFQNNSGSAYDHARRNKFLNDICDHMVIVGDMKRRCIYSAEFDDNFVYVGLTFNYNKRIIDHLNDVRSQIYKHHKPNSTLPKFKQLTDYLDIRLAKYYEKHYADEYLNKGWNILNIAETGAVGGGYLLWTKELCEIQANKYDTKIAFIKKSNLAYDAAYYHGWLDDICKHMKILSHERTKEECQQDALKYTSRKVFSTKSSASYTKAIRSGWLDEICTHMIKYRRNNK